MKLYEVKWWSGTASGTIEIDVANNKQEAKDYARHCLEAAYNIKPSRMEVNRIGPNVRS